MRLIKFRGEENKEYWFNPDKITSLGIFKTVENRIDNLYNVKIYFEQRTHTAVFKTQKEAQAYLDHILGELHRVGVSVIGDAA